ncbi:MULTISPECIES: hypothetical protein [unclassified Paenibacillus]|nr:MULTISPECIES: hypothetical protein [unclassified Paenibacillus]
MIQHGVVPAKLSPSANLHLIIDRDREDRRLRLMALAMAAHAPRA